MDEISRSFDRVRDFFDTFRFGWDGPEEEDEDARAAAETQRERVLSSTGHASAVLEPLIGG